MATLGVDSVELEKFRHQFMEELARNGMLRQSEPSPGETTEDDGDTINVLPDTSIPAKFVVPKTPKLQKLSHPGTRKPKSVEAGPKISKVNGIQKRTKILNTNNQAPKLKRASALKDVTLASAQNTTVPPKGSKSHHQISNTLGNRQDADSGGGRAQPDVSIRKFIM